ncbi:helix-turn-helix domain-containing protein [Paenibacillus sp. J2TS4]|uniref:helix-turn-helix domain-containing protein n=1 Tax=Paenibacillus sp. J2TS4 TaxID=2807194 RepID=UPI001B2D8FEC|nr:helix-turn-helix domain-containing protein [Paenibacillus sp. J2TS4]GIP32246.1 hypothetical protein J2TS4_14560 [Paenibacillus sp. J2TS4]
MNKTWFYRTLFSYLPVFFIVTAFLFFIFFQTLSVQNRNNAVKANDFLAQQAIQLLDYSLKSIDEKVTLDIMNNQDLARYFAQDQNVDLYLDVQAMNAMQQLQLANPLIDSIYLVRFNDQTVLSGGTSYPLEQFPDASFVQQQEHAPNSRWSNARTYKETFTNTDHTVVSLTRGIPIFSQNKGMMVVNVKTDTLLESVSQMFDAKVSFMNLLDREGNQLFSAAGSERVQQASEQGIASQEVFAEYSSDYTEWKLQSGLRNGTVVHFITSLYNIWLAVGLMMVIGGIVWMIYVTKRNYKPIELIVSRIQTYSQQKARSGGSSERNEFHFIQTALEGLIEEANDFEKQHEKDLSVKRKFMFYELLEGTRPLSMEEWRQEMGRFHMPEVFGRQMVFVIEIDRYSDFCRKYNSRDQNLMKFALSSVVQESAGTRYGPIWTLWSSGNQLSGMLHVPEGERDDGAYSVSLLESIRDWVDHNLSLTVTIGIGEAVDHPTGLKNSYREALDGLNYKAVLGTNRWIRSTEIGKPRGEVYSHQQLIQAVVRHYRFSEEEWRSSLHELFAQIRSSLLSRQDIAGLMNHFLFHLNRAIDGMGEEFQSLWNNEILPRMYEALDSFETVDGIEEQWTTILDDYAGHVRELRQSRNHLMLMEEVKTFIENRFTDPDLSLDSLGDQFGMNGKYVSKLFKEVFGVKFVDFLIELRMRHAKRLLTETADSVQDIAVQTGYGSSISFIRTFKKITGVSPGDFRKNSSHGDIN